MTGAIIGVLATFAVALITLTLRNIDSVGKKIEAQLEGFRGEVKAEFGTVRAEISGLRGEMNARFDAVDHRLELLEDKVFRQPT